MDPQPPPSQVSLSHVRLALQRAAEQRSMRRVAQEVGISLGGIHKVIHGATPRPANYRRLVRWYFAQADRPDEPSLEEVRQLAELLVGDLRDEALTTSFVQALGAIVEVAYRARGVREPAWIGQARSAEA